MEVKTKKIILIGILISVILISGAGCEIKDIGWKTSDSNKTELQKEIKINGCPEGIIPERLELREMADFYNIQFPVPPYSRSNKPTWADGTPLIGYTCYLGSKPGENINYIYCGKIGGLGYARTPEPINGIIQKEIRYSIQLTLDSNDHTEEGYKIISSKCY